MLLQTPRMACSCPLHPRAGGRHVRQCETGPANLDVVIVHLSSFARLAPALHALLSRSAQSCGMSLRFCVQAGNALLPDRARPSVTREYTTVECAYCDGDVFVPSSSFESSLPRRMHCHLQACPEFHWDLAPLRRSRALSVKPCGAERSLVQLNLGKGGLERHELGSLLRCLASKRVALDSKPQQASGRTEPPAWALI